jgi:hypothetical protein
MDQQLNQTNTQTVQQTPVPNTVVAQDNKNSDYMAIGSLVLGVLNLCSWFVPLFGCPMSIIGIILGYMGTKSSKYKTLAIIGIVLSVLAFIATLINSIAGAMLAASLSATR